MPTDDRELISEPIEPDPDSFTVDAGAGAPLLPCRFTWRERTFEIARVARTWKTTDAGHRPVGNTYLRRHWVDLETRCGAHMRIYGERGGRPRWFLHSRTRESPRSGGRHSSDPGPLSKGP